MKKEYMEIDNIPSIIWGVQSNRVYLYVHGQGGNKEEAAFFSEIVCQCGYQVLSIDLPEHGVRKETEVTFDPWHIVPELTMVIKYAQSHWENISLFANSIGAYFCMLSFSNVNLEKALFVSPVLDMKKLISNMMSLAGVSENYLQEKQVIKTNFGQTLSWGYWQYVLKNPIKKWTIPTKILYGENDNLIECDTVKKFSKKFDCDLTIMEKGEHWFHTEQQLRIMHEWVNKFEVHRYSD